MEGKVTVQTEQSEMSMAVELVEEAANILNLTPADLIEKLEKQRDEKPAEDLRQMPTKSELITGLETFLESVHW